MPHFLDLFSVGADSAAAIVETAIRWKQARAGWPRGRTDAKALLDGHVLAAIFEKPSTRTRVSFDMAMRQLGGTSMILSAQDMQLGRGEPIADTARVLSRYIDVIMLRTSGHDLLEELARCADVPVINGLTDLNHPCQALADVMTYIEHRGPVAGSRWAYFGDGNNMANALIEAAGVFGFHLQLAVAQGYEPAADHVLQAQAMGSRIELVSDPLVAARDADVIVTDTWVSMGQADVGEKYAAMLPFQVSADVMAAARPEALFMHCLPAHRDEEVVTPVIDGPQSVVWDEAENRLHVQKAILAWTLDRLG